MAESDRILRLSVAEVLCLFGIGLFVLSLALPAAEMGSGATSGIKWFALGTLTAFSPTRTEAANLSLVALMMNSSCIVSVAAVFNGWRSAYLRIWPAIIGGCCAVVLYIHPYSNFERVYIGYHLWLASAVWILLTPIVSEKLTCNAAGGDNQAVNGSRR